jgi:hypothetical protein
MTHFAEDSGHNSDGLPEAAARVILGQSSERSIRAWRGRSGRPEAVSLGRRGGTTVVLARNVRQIMPGARSGSPRHGLRRQIPNGLHSRGEPGETRLRIGALPGPRASEVSALRPMTGDQALRLGRRPAWGTPQALAARQRPSPTWQIVSRQIRRQSGSQAAHRGPATPSVAHSGSARQRWPRRSRLPHKLWA